MNLIRNVQFHQLNQYGKNYKYKMTMRKHFLHKFRDPAKFMCSICSQNFKKKKVFEKTLSFLVNEILV